MNKCVLPGEFVSLLEEAEKIIIGLSGGADSVALTHLLFKEFGPEKLLAAHINHGIRGDDGNRDEAFVRQFCKELKIPLRVLRADVPQMAEAQGIGIEECGRRVRYGFFKELCGPGDEIVTAHNQEDNGETLLWNLCRGTGLWGMGGIAPVRENILRPLLTVSRREIEAYVQDRGLSFVTDSTNTSLDYTRNRIRHEVLPILRQLNSAADGHLAAAAENAFEAAMFIEDKAYALLCKSDCWGGLRVKDLLAEGTILAKEALRIYAKKQGARPERKHLEALMAMLENPRGSLSLPGGVQAVLSQGVLVLQQETGAVPDEIPLVEGRPVTFGAKQVILRRKVPDKNGKINNLLFKNSIDCAKIKNVLVVGARRDGDRFAPAGRGITKSLKNLFQEAGIPAPLRGHMAVIRDGGAIVFVEGFGVSTDYETDGFGPCFEVEIPVGKKLGTR